MLQTRDAHFRKQLCRRFASESIARPQTHVIPCIICSLCLDFAIPSLFLFHAGSVCAFSMSHSIYQCSFASHSCALPVSTHRPRPPSVSCCLSRRENRGLSTTIPRYDERGHHERARQPSMTPNNGHTCQLAANTVTVTDCLWLPAGRW